MLDWIIRGLRTRIVTTRYPARADAAASPARSRLVVDPELCRPAEHDECAAVCPTAAITVARPLFRLDLGLCIQCGRCVTACPNEALGFAADQEVAVRSRADLVTEVEQC